VVERNPGPLAQVAGELRRASRDLSTALRSTTCNIAAEARKVLAELDAPQVDRPSRWRRSWRRFRRSKMPVQLTLGFTLFAIWAWLVIRVLAS
jgi:hypothetical protein